MFNHEKINEAFDQLNIAFNEENNNLKIQEINPGNLFYSPVIIRNSMDSKNSFFKFDDISDGLKEIEKALTRANECKLPLHVGTIKDAQIRGNFFVARKLLGYVLAYRLQEMNTENIILHLNPLIKELKLDILEMLNATENNKFIGTHFLQFRKNKEGNYLTDIEGTAAWNIIATSNCSICPPDIINAKTFDKNIAIQWNIRL